MSQEIYQFHDFRVDIAKGVLVRHGQPVSLQWKTFELLCLLVKSDGRLVTRDEVMDELWADTFVEDNNLSQHVRLLRKALGENGNGNGTKFIETVAGRGFRFVADVKKISVSASDPQIAHLRSEGHESARPATIKRLGLPLLAFAVLLAAAFGLYLYDPNTNTSTVQPIRSIAVLPLKSLSQNAGDEELRLRITDAVITRLGGLNDIVTRPTDSVLRFSQSEESIIEIGQKLEVDAVLDGRIQHEGENVRVTLQLVSVRDGKQIWSEQFDGRAGQILSLQDAVAARVLQTINQDRQQKMHFAKRPTENSEAYESYLKGNYFSTRFDGKNLLKAIDHYKQAVELDPQFADGYAALADVQFRLYVSGFDNDLQNVEVSQGNLEKALAIDAAAAKPLITLGYIQTIYGWDWEKAEKSFKRAIEINPKAVGARMRYGMLLYDLRRFDEARTELELAVRLDPINPGCMTHLAEVYFYQKDFSKADELFLKALEFDEKWTPAHWAMARSLWMQRRKDEAIKYVVSGINSRGNREFAQIVEERSRIDTPDEVVRFIVNTWHSNPKVPKTASNALWAMQVGDREKSLAWLETSFEDHHPTTHVISAVPELQPLRNEPRFQEILRKMNLPL